MTDLSPGDVVVCADGSPPLAAPHLALKDRGIYRIEHVHWFDDWDEGPAAIVELVGVESPSEHGRTGWCEERFDKIRGADCDVMRMADKPVGVS